PAAEGGPGAAVFAVARGAALGVRRFGGDGGQGGAPGDRLLPAPVGGRGGHGGFGGAVRRAVWVPLRGGRKMEGTAAWKAGGGRFLPGQMREWLFCPISKRKICFQKNGKPQHTFWRAAVFMALL